jgi:hypothetical protein
MEAAIGKRVAGGAHLQRFVQRLGICLHACCGDDDARRSADCKGSQPLAPCSAAGMLCKALVLLEADMSSSLLLTLL